MRVAENGKQSQSDNSEPPHQTTGEEVDDSTEKEQDIGPHNNNAENSNPAELEQEQEQEVSGLFKSLLWAMAS